MSGNVDERTQLTEFPPLSPEDKSSFGFGGLTRFFKLGKSSESPEHNSNNNPGKNGETNWQSSTSSMESADSSSLQYPVNIGEGRSLPNVLKRISNILALRSVGLMAYKDTDLKQYWMPDSFSKECYDCGEKFTTFRRRHHCRVCGQIFCSRCCNQEIPGKIMGCTGDLRVCTYCCKVVLSYLQSADIRADLSADLRALQEDLQTKFGNSITRNGDDFHTSNKASGTPERELANVCIRRKSSVGYQEERFVHGRSQNLTVLSEEERCQALQNSSSLRSLYEEIVQPPNGISLQSHRHRLKVFPNCFVGSELIDWLMTQNKAGTRVQGIAIGQALLEAGFIESLGEVNFSDGLSLYRPVLTSPAEQSNSGESQEPLWMKQIPQKDSSNATDSESEKMSEVDEESVTRSASSYCLDINLRDSVVHVSRPSPPPGLDESKDQDGNPTQPGGGDTVKDSLKTRKESNDIMLNTEWDKSSTYIRPTYVEDPSYQILSSAFEHHIQNLVQQMLNTEGISQSWSEVILPIAKDIVNLVRPDMKKDTDEMDIRHYVQIKKLPGGQKSESCIVSGVVCSKNIAHRLMRTRIHNPRILLLRCSVVYQRNEGRLLSLEPVMMQEQEYLRHVVARIAALQPDIVMVNRNVSRLAQEYLLKLGITLVLNTKLTVLERVSRFTQADIVNSVDAHISKPQLGTCGLFYLKTFDTENGSKTLMFFEGCANPELSCTLLLRGGASPELKRLKSIVNFVVFACYNWRLEKSFLMDEYARPPSPPSELFEESPEQDAMKINYSSENKSESKVKIDKEDRRITVEPVQDCSDPLQSYLNLSDEVASRQPESSPVEEFSVAELPFGNKFRKALDETILSISLYIKCNVPYLETEAGRNCVLRSYFPNEIFYSNQFLDKNEPNRAGNVDDHQQNLVTRLKDVKLLPKHPFVTAKVTDTVNSAEVQALLALYRANGGRIPLQLGEREKRSPRESLKADNKTQETMKRLDVLDPANHQRLPVLFCSYSCSSQNFPAFCVNPWVVNMHFYGMDDIPLGSFLERYCFRTSYICPSVTCDTPMLDHVRRFVHDPGCVHLTLNHLEELDSKQILMWSWCPKCRTASPMVPMSSETWSFSFAKYLELRFRGHVYARRDTDSCKHSLHHDHYQYFGMNKVVALFKFSPVAVWEISLPSPIVNVRYDPLRQTAIMDELRNLAIKGHDIYSSVVEKLLNLEGSEEDIQAMKHQQQKEQAHFKSKIEEIQVKLTSPLLESKKSEGPRSEKDVESLLWKIEDSVMYLRRLISEAVIGWNARFQDAVNVAKKKDDKEKEKQKRVSEGAVKTANQPPSSDGQEQRVADGEENDDESVDDDVVFETSAHRPVGESTLEGDGDSEDNASSRPANNSTDTFDELDRMSDDARECRKGTSNDESQNDSKHDKKSVKNILSQILTSNKDFCPLQSPWPIQEHYLLPPGPVAYVMVHENEPSSIISYALASYDYQRDMEEIQQRKMASSVASEAPTPSPINKRKASSITNNSEKDGESHEGRKSNMLSSLLRGSNLPVGSQGSGSKTPESGSHASGSTSKGGENGSQTGNESEEKEEASSSSSSSKKIQKSLSCQHVEIMFSDSTTNFFCRVYFAEQFFALRQAVFPVGEEAFVRSLSRCVQWQARGGKSGSTFCKTKDDRFILKEMSKLELQLFLDFATHYFSYNRKCRERAEPTLLGKIVGVYTVSFRNSNSNSALKSNLLIMENLFYMRNVTQKYDLKGSVRNRLVNPVQNEEEVVYLDENLLKMTTDSPLYILPHSQAVLMRAIESDTQFLASQTVMDYSLLVGLDESKRELVIGIIDYIRTFTWDKKLETMVKKSVIMGGQGKQPTIIQPKDYRERFIAAMHRYFLPVPDRWSGLGKIVDS